MRVTFFESVITGTLRVSRKCEELAPGQFLIWVWCQAVNGEFTIHCLTPNLLRESADVRGLSNDDALHGLEQLRACGVGVQVQHRAQRVELENVMMVPRGQRERQVRNSPRPTPAVPTHDLSIRQFERVLINGSK